MVRFGISGLECVCAMVNIWLFDTELSGRLMVFDASARRRAAEKVTLNSRQESPRRRLAV